MSKSSIRIKEEELLTEIKLEKQEIQETPIIIQSIIDTSNVKQEFEETFQCELPEDDDYGEIEVLDEYIEEVKGMSPTKFKVEVKSEPDVINESKIIQFEPMKPQSHMNLRGVKINLNKMLGMKIKLKSAAQTLDPSQIEVPSCFSSSDRPFRCKKCPLAFKYRRGLTAHRALHKKADFWCRKCGQKFRFQLSYMNHDCDYFCKFCNKRISNKANLKIHMSYVHGIGDAKLFTCDICGNTYKSKRNIDTHMKHHMQSTPFNCAICGKGFSHAGALKIHMWNHRDLVTCEICSKKFKPRSLYYHIKKCRQMHESGEVNVKPMYRHQKVVRIININDIDLNGSDAHQASGSVVKVKSEANTQMKFIHLN